MEPAQSAGRAMWGFFGTRRQSGVVVGEKWMAYGLRLNPVDSGLYTDAYLC